MIASATLDHHLSREWIAFWQAQAEAGLHVLYTHRVASVYCSGQIHEFIIDRDFRAEITDTLEQLKKEI